MNEVVSKSKRKKILGVILLLFVITKSSREESPEYRQTQKLILLGRYVAGRNGPSNAMSMSILTLRQSLMSSLTTGLGSLFLKFRRRKNLEACMLLILSTRCVEVYNGS